MTTQLLKALTSLFNVKWQVAILGQKSRGIVWQETSQRCHTERTWHFSISHDLMRDSTFAWLKMGSNKLSPPGSVPLMYSVSKLKIINILFQLKQRLNFHLSRDMSVSTLKLFTLVTNILKMDYIIILLRNNMNNCCTMRRRNKEGKLLIYYSTLIYSSDPP